MRTSSVKPNVSELCQSICHDQTIEGTAMELDARKFSYLDRDVVSFCLSLIVHVSFIVLLALLPWLQMLPKKHGVITIDTSYTESQDSFHTDLDLSAGSDFHLALPERRALEPAATIDMLSARYEVNDVELGMVVEQSIAHSKLIPSLVDAIQVKRASGTGQGETGYGVVDTASALDQLTVEILRSLEQRPTLVVWIFDASISLSKRREEIEQRLARVYAEIDADRMARPPLPGMGPRLLTSVYSFGESINLLLRQPTADVREIQRAINNIAIDPSGTEYVFSAVYKAAQNYSYFREPRKKGGERNVMLVLITDERGDDRDGLESTIELCNKFKMPVYVLGVPAPFGQSYTFVRFPSSQAGNQRPFEWSQIDQGPESAMLERLQLTYKNELFEQPIVDSGFGAYSLSRLCYETGGIFFTIHQNRNYARDLDRSETPAYAAHIQSFFDPNAMASYRPDYQSLAEYHQQLTQNPLRSALVKASEVSVLAEMDAPPRQFVEHKLLNTEGRLSSALIIAERSAAALESMCKTLEKACASRSQELSPRWLAGYDLAKATAKAAQLRNLTYLEIVKDIKAGRRFENSDSNTWLLVPSFHMPMRPEYEQHASVIYDDLQRIAQEHPGTPWSYFAQLESDRPMLWEIVETTTRVTESYEPNVGANDFELRRGGQGTAPARAVPRL